MYKFQEEFLEVFQKKAKRNFIRNPRIPKYFVQISEGILVEIRERILG